MRRWIDTVSRALSSGNVAFSFSTGEDGNLTASSGTTTLTRDTYYNRVTLTGTGQIATNGYLLFAKVIDLSQAGANAITWAPSAAGNASGATGGSAGAASTATTLGIGTV